jgi:hypothetical protein
MATGGASLSRSLPRRERLTTSIRRRAAILCTALVLLPGAAWSQGNPVGPEFVVNSYTTSAQNHPSVGRDSLGNLVVVWSSYGQDDSEFGIFGQRFDASGAAVGPEFQVNTYTAGRQYLPSVTVGSPGDFVVVWMSIGQDGSQQGVFGQRYAASGVPLGPEFRVNTYTTGYQYSPDVGADSAGNFTVVWASDGQDGSSYGVFGQRYASSGMAVGPEFRVNTYASGHQRQPSVAADPAGNLVVTWVSEGQDGSNIGVFGQRYASSGAAVGPEFRVNTYTTGNQYRPSVAADPSGGFVVVWQSLPQDGSDHGVYAQRYAGSGTPLGPEFRVNTYTPNAQQRPFIATDSSGNFVVVWQSLYQDGSIFGAFGQRYSAAGTPEGPEFRINTYTTYVQSYPAVAADPAGNFVVVWQSTDQDGSSFGAVGQRFGAIVPLELIHFGVE